MTLDNWMDIPGDAEEIEEEPEDDELYDAEERGRIKHHSKKGDLKTLLFTLGQTGPQLRPELMETFESPEGVLAHYDYHETFENIDGIGPSRNEDLEAAVPIIREALDEPEIVYFLGCDSCSELVKSADAGIDCPKCGAKVMQCLGFVGAAALAEAVEEADLPDHIDVSRLDAATAYDLVQEHG